LDQLQNVVKPGRGQGQQSENTGQLQLQELNQSGMLKNSFTSLQVDASSSDAGQQDSEEPSAADNLNSLVQECGLPPHKISELFQELPPRRFSDALIDYYFDAMYVDLYILREYGFTIYRGNRNWTRYPISERDFRTAYTSICANGIGINPNDVRFLPLLFVVLAIGVRLAPEHLAGDARSRRINSLRYYWSCASS
jgi:hypothetical protein